MADYLKVGDVIEGDERFVYSVSESTKSKSIGYHEKGQYYGKWGSRDPSRVGARFVVERAEEEGGGEGMGRGDTYPDGHHVIIRRLFPDGSYNDAGELLSFYQSGAFNCMIRNPKIVGHMTKVFIR
jgi:hypothetical protein